MAGIPERAWPSYVGETFRVLKPGTGVAVFIEMNPRSKSETEDLSKTYLRQVSVILILC
jgi:ubiquinone/menaquinone biosynthesis C-methylase UbiE